MGDRLKVARTSYDRLADTFYITLSKEKVRRSVEDDDGLVWRYDERGAAVGVTVQAYHRLWAGRLNVLAQRIAQPLSVEVSAIARRLPH